MTHKKNKKENLNGQRFKTFPYEITYLVREFQYTLYNTILRIARNLLETREDIPWVESHSFYHIICDRFSWGSSNFFFLFKKRIQNGRFSKGHFSKSPILKIFLWKFHGLVLKLVGLIDAKGIDLAQPVWSWGRPT